MRVNRIIGKCPGCGAEDAYGNVLVAKNILIRGCLNCKHSEQWPLPALSKVIIYLDQFFLSHAFRGKPEFVKVSGIITDLADSQLLVCPRSSIHEDETHQWRDYRQKELWEFIRQASRGHEFAPEYEIKRRQIQIAFKRFLAKDSDRFPISPDVALPKNVNDWDDYFRVEINRPPDNVEELRRLKEQSTERFVNVFPKWRRETTSFEEDRHEELSATYHGYLELYFTKLAREMNGDLLAELYSPVDAQIVQSLLRTGRKVMEDHEYFERIQDFFNSEYFQEVPYEDISAGLFAVLRQRIKNGHYENPEKAKKRLSGFFFDVKFISAYAPYCDAMFLDNAMFDLVNDPQLKLKQKYGTKFFSRNNWDQFIGFLNAIDERKSRELDQTLKLVYP